MRQVLVQDRDLCAEDYEHRQRRQQESRDVVRSDVFARLSLRIDFTPTKDGNGILFTNYQIYVFKDGKVDSNRPYVHPLMVLGFDIYRLPQADVIEKLKGLKFDLSIFREDTWQGRPVYVVGAKAGRSAFAAVLDRPKESVFCAHDSARRQRWAQTQETQFNKYGSSAAAGCRRKSSSWSMGKSSPRKNIPSCARMWRLTDKLLIRNISRLFTGENSVGSPRVSKGRTRFSRFELLELPSLTVGLLTHHRRRPS